MVFMKTMIVTALIAAGALSARAQLFGPESMSGALLGGLAGAVIGHNSGRHAGEGIAIGAGAGLLLGAIAGEARREQDYASAPPPPPPNTFPASYYQPAYAGQGMVLGGVVGGIIGHNHHRQTAEGVAIGAGTGLLVGALADHHARHTTRSYRAPASPAAGIPPPPAVPAAPAPAVPDAPRVPDAPTFGIPAVPPTTAPASASGWGQPVPQPVTIINNYYHGSTRAVSTTNVVARP